MGSLACIGCSKMISLKDGQLTEFKIHMMDTHNFFKEINSVINVAFLNVAEEETLDQLLGPRIKHFLRTGAHQPWEENVFERRSSQELEDSDLPDIDETVSDDEEDELGKEGDLDKIQDKTLEFKLLEKLMKSVEGTVQPMGTEEEGEPAKTDGKYVENLRAKIREDEEEESDAETSIKGGEEDNDSDTDPFSPPVTPQKRLPTFNPIDSNQQDDQNHFGTTLEMSAPTSLAADVKFEKIPSSLTAPQVKIERALVLDVLGNSLEGNTREILDSHNEKRRLVENPDEGVMFDGEFERIMFDDKRRVSSKREEEDPPQLTEFCRLCYCSLVGTSMDQHVEEEHLEDKEALLIEPSEDNLAHFCPVCPLRYLTENLLNKHQSVMHKPAVESKIKCKICEKTVSGRKMKMHMQTHGEKRYECKLCYTKFALRGYLRQHCNKTHKDDQELLSREITENDLQFPCTENNCEKKFVTQKILDWHKMHIHTKTNFNCNFCAEEFPSALLLRTHAKKAHTRKSFRNEAGFQCKLCYKSFAKKSNLVAHKYVHKSDRDAFERKLQDSDLIFECQHEHCGKRFISESILKYHTNDNHRELEFKYLKNPTAKDHTCPLCYIKFKSFYTMHNHILEAHKDDKDLLRAGEKIGEAQFPCSTCEQKFVRPSILEYHENRIHRKHLKSVHSQKENKCKLCYREFNTSKHLSGHERIHQKDKAAFGRQICDSELKFHCKEADCNKRFISDNILRYHMRTMHGEHVVLEFRHLKKHGETAHNCPLCLVQFKSFYNMHRHILDHHSKEEKELLKTEGGLDDPKCKCTRCEKSFVTESILDKHIERAHKSKSADVTKPGESWACNFCTKIFPTCSLVQAHSLKAHNKKYHCKDPLLLKYECVLCRNKFMKNKYLRKHQENVHKEDREFLLSGITDDDLVHKCSLCPTKFVSETSLALHKERIHKKVRMTKGISSGAKSSLGNNSSPNYKCSSCDQEFDVHAQLRKHSLKVHKERTSVVANQEKRFKCKLCYHQFDFNCYLDQHQKGVHKDELHLFEGSFTENDLKISCENCDKKFLSQNSKDFHRRYQHKEELKKLASVKSDRGENKPIAKTSFSCILCYNKFSFNGDYKKHIGKFHTTEDEVIALENGFVEEAKLSFSCNSCDKKFLNTAILKYHQMYTHRAAKGSLSQGGTTFCKLCYVRFQKSKALRSHIAKVHKDEMHGFSVKLEELELRHTCDQCNRKFWTKNILDHHTKTRHKDLSSKEKSCNLCQVNFKVSDYRRQHVKKIHKTKDELEALNFDSDFVFDVPCDHCDKRVYSKRCLAIHTSRLHSSSLPRELSCRLCQVDFKDIYKQRAHVSNVHKGAEELEAVKQGAAVVLEMPCKHCGKHLFSSKTLDYHIRSVHRAEENKLNQGTYCKLCYIRYEKPKSLIQHKAKVHIDEMDGFNVKLEDSQLKYSCDQCKRKFWTENILENHKRTRHISPLPKETFCRICQIDFRDPKGQRSHIRNVHKSKEEREAINEGPNVLLKIPCQQCEQKVYSLRCLSLHISSSHKRHLPNDVTCPLCQVRFKNVFRQRVHVRNMHKTNAELEAIREGGNVKMGISCKHCGKGVYSAKTLDYHVQKLHREENKVDQECELCHKVFKWDHAIKSKMRQHMMKMHGKKTDVPDVNKTPLNFQYMYMMSIMNRKS